MWRAYKDIVYAALATSVLIVIVAEAIVWAITGEYIGR